MTEGTWVIHWFGTDRSDYDHRDEKYDTREEAKADMKRDFIRFEKDQARITVVDDGLTWKQSVKKSLEFVGSGIRLKTEGKTVVSKPDNDLKSKVQKVKSAHEAQLQAAENLTRTMIAFLEADLQKKISGMNREYKILLGRNPLVHDMENEAACRKMVQCNKEEDLAIKAKEKAVSAYCKTAMEFTAGPTKPTKPRGTPKATKPTKPTRPTKPAKPRGTPKASRAAKAAEPARQDPQVKKMPDKADWAAIRASASHSRPLVSPGSRAQGPQTPRSAQKGSSLGD